MGQDGMRQAAPRSGGEGVNRIDEVRANDGLRIFAFHSLGDDVHRRANNTFMARAFMISACCLGLSVTGAAAEVKAPGVSSAGGVGGLQ